MLVYKAITHDARVHRSARSLAAHGYEVTVVCASDEEPDADLQDNGFQVLHTKVGTPRDARRAAAGKAQRARLKRNELLNTLAWSEPTPRNIEDLEELRRDEALWARRARQLSDPRRGGKHLDRPYQAAWTDFLRSARPDVIHVHDYQGLGTALGVAGPRTKVVYDAHEHVLGKTLDAADRRVLAAYLRDRAPRADAVITVGETIADVLVEELRLPARPVVVHNTPSLCDVRPAPYDLRAAAGIDRETPLLVYSGSTTIWRRLDTAIAALTCLPQPHLALVLIGDKSVPGLQKTAERLGVRDRVHFLPPVPPESVISLVSGADVGLIPLERYVNGDLALPNKLFEYLHAGLPMAVSDSPTMARFVQEHALGEVAPADDHEAWARAVGDVLASGPVRLDRSNGRAELRRKWSWEGQEPALLELYEDLSRQGAART
jgi:glycosyltransferase involved in cell wall biosynthesis